MYINWRLQLLCLYKNNNDKMGNHQSEIEEQRLQEWLDIIANRASAACNSKITIVANGLLDLLTDLQADKNLLAKVAAQQNDLLKMKNLDIAPLVRKAEITNITDDSVPLVDYSLMTLGTIIALIIVLMILCIIICIYDHKSRHGSNSSSNGEHTLRRPYFATTETPFKTQRSCSLRSIAPS